jgi:hypothetical protein
MDTKPFYKKRSSLSLDINLINENFVKENDKKFVNKLRNTVNNNKTGFVNKLRNLIKEYSIED